MEFPKSEKTAKYYFSPFLPHVTIPGIIGYKKINEPFDSLKWLYNGMYTEYEDTSDAVNEGENWLTIAVDTVQEMDIQESFFKLDEIPSYFLRPSFRILTEDGRSRMVKCNKDTSFVLKAMPVIISNLTTYPKTVFIKSMNIQIIQEAKNEDGKWRPIELPMVFPCGMGFHWHSMQPNDQIVTSIFKYRGTYKTLLRLKLECSGRVAYSKEFSGSINYSQFNADKMEFEGCNLNMMSLSSL